MLHKIIRRFDANDDHTNELRSDLAGIWQKVDIRAISINSLSYDCPIICDCEHTATGHSF